MEQQSKDVSAYRALERRLDHLAQAMKTTGADTSMPIEAVEQLNGLVHRFWDGARQVIEKQVPLTKDPHIYRAVRGVITDRGEASNHQTSDGFLHRLTELRLALDALAWILLGDDTGPAPPVVDCRHRLGLMTFVFVHSPHHLPVQPVFTVYLNRLIRHIHAVHPNWIDTQQLPHAAMGVETNDDFRQRVSAVGTAMHRRQDILATATDHAKLNGLCHSILTGRQTTGDVVVGVAAQPADGASESFDVALGSALLIHTDEIGEHIPALRLKLQTELGHPLPAVRVIPDAALPPHGLDVRWAGRTLESIHVYPQRRLAIHPPGAEIQLDGEPTQEPTFGLPATWIDETQLMAARLGGFMVADGLSVILTFLSDRLQANACFGFNRHALDTCLSIVSEHPQHRLAALRATMSDERLLAVFRELVAQRISLRNPAAIINAVLLFHGHDPDPVGVVERIRPALARRILGPLRFDDDALSVVRLTDETRTIYQVSAEDSVTENASMMRAHDERLVEAHFQSIRRRRPTLLVVPTPLRRRVSKRLKPKFPGLHVLSEAECRHVAEQATWMWV
ncbi:MAG: FHIPEP family type III secretion protein [Myxococcota bacterium]|nr:FHIPEP family type III secretion protein [Myxococcota bacterium]